MATLLLLLTTLLHPAPAGNPPPSCGDTDDCDGDGWTPADGDCDDGVRQIYPGSVEVCDGWDNDCDGWTDEGVQRRWYPVGKDAAACRVVNLWDAPVPGTIYRCQQPVGYVPACPRI